MSNINESIKARANGACELCTQTDGLSLQNILPVSQIEQENYILLCSTCKEQMNDTEKRDPNHFRCLNDSMWSEQPAVQISVWRLLHDMRGEGWPQDLLDMMYMDDQVLKRAKEGASENVVQHKDSNGAILQTGDSVVLIKDLVVKGANFTAKRGTAVRRISVVTDNAEHIEGKINGQRIVILTQYVKKQG